MQRDGRRTLIGGNPARVEVRWMLLVDPDPELDGDGHVGALRGANSG